MPIDGQQLLTGGFQLQAAGQQIPSGSPLLPPGSQQQQQLPVPLGLSGAPSAGLDLSESTRQQHPLVQKIQEIQQATCGLADPTPPPVVPVAETVDTSQQQQQPLYSEVVSGDGSTNYSIQARADQQWNDWKTILLL